MIKGLIFDLDGTILDTLEDINSAIKVGVCKDITIEETRQRVGNGFRMLVKRCLDNESEEKIDKCLKIFIDEYSKCYNNKTKAYDGIDEVLKELDKRNILLAVNSNKGDYYTKELVKNHFKGINFVDVIGSCANIPNKPNPYNALKIIEKMQLNKDEVLYVGDSETDINTAINAGLKSIGCVWGFRSLEEIKKANATYVAFKPSDILKIINL